MKDYSDSIVLSLLKIGAIKFNFETPFTWTSGVKSPMYCDNRVSLSNHNLRSMVRDAYVEIIKKEFPKVEIIAGVATGAISQGTLVADRLDLPFIYVREKRKEHGLMKIIEGHFKVGQNAVIIEDHISTGGSSLRAWEELKDAGVNVLGMVSSFSYDFHVAKEKFTTNDYKLHTISTFSTIRDIAHREGYINNEEVEKLNEWHKNISFV